MYEQQPLGEESEAEEQARRDYEEEWVAENSNLRYPAEVFPRITEHPYDAPTTVPGLKFGTLLQYTNRTRSTYKAENANFLHDPFYPQGLWHIMELAEQVDATDGFDILHAVNSPLCPEKWAIPLGEQERWVEQFYYYLHRQGVGISTADAWRAWFVRELWQTAEGWKRERAVRDLLHAEYGADYEIQHADPHTDVAKHLDWFVVERDGQRIVEAVQVKAGKFFRSTHPNSVSARQRNVRGLLAWQADHPTCKTVFINSDFAVKEQVLHRLSPEDVVC